MTRVFNLSGGRTSATMTIENYKPGDIVIFCDTEREDYRTYKFLDDIEKNENIPIVRLKYSGGFKELIRKRRMIPNVMMRFCTIELKIKTARRYLRSLGIKDYENFVGFRFDEPDRVLNWTENWKTVKTIFPLYESGFTKQMVLDYWKNKSYDLETPAILGNCDLCFLKGKNAIVNILRQHPDLAEKWIADEEQIGATYIKGVSYKQLLETAKKPFYTQLRLDDIEPAFNCSCTT